MPDRPAAPRTSTGPNPGGVHEPDSPMPGGAVTGESGIGDAVAPDGGDVGGAGDLGRDEGPGDPGTEPGTEEGSGHPSPEDAAMGDPEEEAGKGRPPGTAR